MSVFLQQAAQAWGEPSNHQEGEQCCNNQRVLLPTNPSCPDPIPVDDQKSRIIYAKYKTAALISRCGQIHAAQ